MFSAASTRLPVRIATLIFVVFVVHQVYFFHQKWPGFGDTILQRLGKDINQIPCSALNGLDDILVILKTGANEAPSKVPRHFHTTLRCTKNYVIYSDLAEEIDGHQIINVLDEVNPNVVREHPDFEYYRRLQENGRNAFTPEEIEKWANAKNTAGGRDSPGWRLDKWKFLPMVNQAQRRMPDAKWYFFIEADTVVIWETVLALLAQIDPSKEWYMGQQMRAGETIFAYGGSGYVLSNSAAKKVADYRNEWLDYWDEFTGKHWAGDCILGEALLDVDIPLTWVFPNLVSEKPANIDFGNEFGGPDRKPWCYYVGTYHHTTLEEAKELLEFNREWRKRNDQPFRHGDIFKYAIRPNLTPERADWDNLSDHADDGSKTIQDCRTACEKDQKCMQWSFIDGRCKNAPWIKLGYTGNSTQRPPSTPEREGGSLSPPVSGWILDRADKFIEEMDASCATTRSWALPQ